MPAAGLAGREWRARLQTGTWPVAAALAPVVALALLSPVAAAAFDFSGDKKLLVRTRDGASVQLGVVQFQPADGNKNEPPGSLRFSIRWTHGALTDYFLSMREFKCLGAATEVTCHVPYPYPQPGTLTPTDLRWLEHSLLFLYKRPADHGAKLWNGLIYAFTVTPDALVGIPQAVDLNRISAPPERLDQPPFTPADRDELAPGTRWLAELRIE